jgi:DNA-directed RNA polymerase subunit beta
VQRNFRIRHSYGQVEHPFEIPNLIDLQRKSYAKFLQMDVDEGEREEVGLESVFRNIFPIEDYSGHYSLEYINYKFDDPPYDVKECLQRAVTYNAPLKVKIRSVKRDPETGEVTELKTPDYVFFGELPLQTEKGTFVINGTERVVVSQLHRSPGAFFNHDNGKNSLTKLLYTARIIPYRGSWLDFEFDAKDILHVRIDRRRKMPATLLLRALGYTTREILHTYYPSEEIEILDHNPTLCKRRFFHQDYLKGAGVVAIKDLDLTSIKDHIGELEHVLKVQPFAKHVSGMMRSLDTSKYKEVTSGIRGSDQRCAYFLETELGSIGRQWFIGEELVNDHGEVIAPICAEMTPILLQQLSTLGKTLKIYDPQSTESMDALRTYLRDQLTDTDASSWALSRPLYGDEVIVSDDEDETTTELPLIAAASSQVNVSLLLNLLDLDISSIHVNALDGTSEVDFMKDFVKQNLKSEVHEGWSAYESISLNEYDQIEANERLNVGLLIRLAQHGIDQIKVYTNTTFSTPNQMKRRFGITIDEGYVLMKTDDLRGWALSNDIVDTEGDSILKFNADLNEESLGHIKASGVSNFEVFFIDDNLFTQALRTTLRVDRGKNTDFDEADENHSGVDKMLRFIDSYNETLSTQDQANSHDIVYRKDLPYSELAHIEYALRTIYGRIRPGDPSNVENAHKLLKQTFFNSDRYDLSEVGRVKLNHKFKLNLDIKHTTLTKEDVVESIRYILSLHDDNHEIYRKESNGDFLKLDTRIDDIDHLGNRRVRAVGELMENQYRIGLVRMERTIRERMAPRDEEKEKEIKDLINSKPVGAAVREYFGSSQLSQFMDQTNPLSEVTHKRRLSALGPGGLNRDRAGFEVRDVHMTHYGRICPIETPEGPNIGLIASLSTYAKINRHGFIETPYRKVHYYDDEGNPCEKGHRGQVRAKINYDESAQYYNALHEEYDAKLWDHNPQNYKGLQHVAQAQVLTDDDGWLSDPQIRVRASGDFLMIPSTDVNLVDVSPNQLVSVAASLIPFLENDDANRALMGSNMQRQAVPLLVSEAPLVGTGMEITVGRDSGVTLIAQNDGVIDSVDADRIVIRVDDQKAIEPEIHNLVKFRRSNQNTCINQRPIVEQGDRVKKGDVIADGPSTEQGELALGRNVVVAFMPWSGYNFEDSILISERLVQEDVYTSIHIEEFECIARDTKLGNEEITRDISTVPAEALRDLDESGIIRIGAEVKPGHILVGKTTPKGEVQLSPEDKLLRAIFGEKSQDVRDESLRVKTGVVGTVIDTKVFVRKTADKDMRSVHKNYAEEAKLLKGQDRDLATIKRIAFDRIRSLIIGQTSLKTLLDEYRNVLLKRNEVITAEKIDLIPDSKLHSISLKTTDDSLIQRIGDLFEKLDEHQTRIRANFEEKIKKLHRGDDLPPGVLKQVKVYVAIKRKLQIGDKMAGRHGNKGVISRVLPLEDMPFLEDGTPVDMVLNPLGVPSRMNIGQILETHLGWAARGLGKKINRMLSRQAETEILREEFKKYFTSAHHQGLIAQMTHEDLVRAIHGVKDGIHVATPVFDRAPEEQLQKALKLAELREDARSILFDGRTGEAFDNPVTVGVMYVLKLHHLVDEKIHARAIGPYSLVTQQPLGGKAQSGGQRLGEMEVWAMEAYGAAYTLQEFLTVKSDDLKGRTDMYESIVKGEYELNCGLPESFRVLIQELKSLALDVDLIRGNEY